MDESHDESEETPTTGDAGPFIVEKATNSSKEKA